MNNHPKDAIREIVLWKIGRSIEWNLFDDDKLKLLLNSIKEEKYSLDNKEMFNSNTKEYLEKLLSIKGIGIPVASSIMKFCNPKVYPIIDKRAYKVVFCDYINTVLNYKNTKKDEDGINKYIDYVHECHKLFEKNKKLWNLKSFSDLERFAYQLDKDLGNNLGY